MSLMFQAKQAENQSIRFECSTKAPGEIRELFAMVRRNAVTASSPHLSIGDKFVVNQRGKGALQCCHGNNLTKI